MSLQSSHGRAAGCCARLELAIEIFEPRLARARVTSTETLTASSRRSRFTWKRILMIDPAPERIAFDTVLEICQGRVQREGGLSVRDDLLFHYERELTYLRYLGAEFAKKYPKVASRLLLEAGKCEDPHVERLLEGFAFLAARIYLKIDDEFPGDRRIAAVDSVPALPAAHSFGVDRAVSSGSGAGQAESGLQDSQGRRCCIRAPVSGTPCKFRTCYDTTLWPIQVKAADWRSPDRVQPPDAGSRRGGGDAAGTAVLCRTSASRSSN